MIDRNNVPWRVVSVQTHCQLMKHLFLALTFALTAQAAEPITIKLWPQGAPEKPGVKIGPEEEIQKGDGIKRVTNVTDPTLTIYKPENANGTSVLVCPGGGYGILAIEHEGTKVCDYLNTLGVTGVLLKYRTPTRDEAAPHEKPVADAARAIALVREHAKEWNLDPKRVGLLGFSAGGNLLAHIACDRATKTELPDFGIMIYGGGFVDFKDPTKLKEGFTVPKDAPPMFLACAHDDGQNPTAATVLYLEYKKLGIPCEVHLFTKGGHGFGMRDNKQPINAWPQRCAEWMESMHFSLSEQQFDREIEQAEKKLQSKFSQMGLLMSEMKEKEMNEITVQIQDARRLGQTDRKSVV